MSRSSLIICLIAVLASSIAYADIFTINDSGFEKGPAKLFPLANEPFLADTVNGGFQLVHRDSKSNYLVWFTNAATDKANPQKGGTVTAVFRKINILINRVTISKNNVDITVNGFKWGGEGHAFTFGATVKNNVTLIGKLTPEPTATWPVYNLYAYLVDLDKNEKTEITIQTATQTDEHVYTKLYLKEVYSSDGLTVIFYTTETSTTSESTDNKYSTYVVTLKDGKLSAPTLVSEDKADQCAGTYEYAYCVFSKRVVSPFSQTETLIPLNITEKEIKVGTSVVINTVTTEANEYDFVTILPYPKGRWVAIYTQDTTVGGLTTHSIFAKPNNETAFKLLTSYQNTDTNMTAFGDGSKLGVHGFFHGVFLGFLYKTGKTVGNLDTYSYHYHTYGGDLTYIGGGQLLVTSGLYTKKSVPHLFRIGDLKSIAVITPQIKVDESTEPDTETQEGAWFGQLTHKSFGATLQTLLAFCGFTMAALFVF